MSSQSYPPTAAGGERPELVTSPERLALLAQRLRRETRLAFDTEAASFHRYADRIYLVQVSSPHESAIIDPLALPDLSPVGEVLADPGIEIIFHDADYDLRSLYRDYGFQARGIFDTRIAAQLLGEPAVGLGALLLKHFGVTLDKRLQRADWSLRPLTREMIEYAAADTAHLPALRDVLARQLVEKGRLEWAQEEFRRQEAVGRSGPTDDEAPYLRIKGAKALPPRSQLVLRELHAWRERRAKEADRAPFRVLSNEALIALAKGAPSELPALRTASLPSSVAQRYGTALIEVVRQALSVPESGWPRRERRERAARDPDVEARWERLKGLRNRRAQELGLEPGVLCANALLHDLARLGSNGLADSAAIPDLRRWQREALGHDQILSALG